MHPPTFTRAAFLTCVVSAVGCIDPVDVQGGGEETLALTAPAGPQTVLDGGGNGHSMTWDGRVLFITRHNADNPQTPLLQACPFRPTNLTTTGSPARLNFRAATPAYGTCATVFRPNGDFAYTPTGQASALIEWNAHAVVSARSPFANPWRSNADGTANSAGTSATYDLRIYTQVYNLYASNSVWGGLAQNTMGVMRIEVTVDNADAATAAIGRISLVEDWQPLQTVSGAEVQPAIEPTVTTDGRLMVYNQNPGDALYFTYNADPSNRAGWSTPQPITALSARTDLHARYPLARKPIRSALGDTYASSDLLRGAYPWISWEGGDLFFTTAQTSDGATRGAWSVVGESTGGQVRLIDGGFREGPTADQGLVLFTSGIATTSTIWSPFNKLKAPAFPLTNERPVGLFFHSNGNQAVEVSFKSFADGGYLLHYPMSRALAKTHPGMARSDQYVANRTPDIGGRNLPGVLEGGAFINVVAPADYEAQRFMGDHLRVKAQSSVSSTFSGAQLDARAFTFEAAVRPLVDLTANPGNAYLWLVRIPGVLNIILEENRQLQVRLETATDWAARSTGFVSSGLPLNAWSHVAVTWSDATKRLLVYVDGHVVADQLFADFPGGASNGSLRLGPAGWTADIPTSTSDVLAIDEVKVSVVARSADEIADSAGLALSQRGLPAGPFNSPILPSDIRTADRPFNQATVQLGSLLFRDPRLSSNTAVSCATCHKPGAHFADGLAKSVGVTGVALPVHTPSLLNRGTGRAQHWNGRHSSTGAQAWAPIAAADEMGLSVTSAVAQLNSIAAYKTRFQTVFGAAPTVQNTEAALQAFVNAIISLPSRYDLFVGGDTAQLTAAEKAGMALFFGKARCAACHNGRNFTDEQFHDTGFFGSGSVGRGQVSGRTIDLRKVKTPSLRNVARTAPYLHDGSKQALGDVIDLYIAGASASERFSEQVPIALTATEKSDLVAFLGALSADSTFPFAIDLTEALPGIPLPAFTYASSSFNVASGAAISVIPTHTGGTPSGCTVSPGLRTGMTLSSTCAFGGSTTVQGAVTYTVTATNLSGSTSRTVTINVTPPTPVISYSPNTRTFTRTVSVGSINATSTGGTITGCSASPALPAGLALSSVCVLSGTPTAVQAQTTYTITATNSAGSGQTTLAIRVNERGPTIAYAPNSFAFKQGSAIAAATPSNTGGPIASCAASPALPAGLSLGATTCAITGTPTALQSAATTTITATNSGGSSATTVSIAVVPPAPVLAYSPNAHTFTRTVAISAIAPVSSGGAISSCSVTPALPAGLVLSSTCVLSGTPTVVKASTSHTVTASNAGGTGQTTVSIRVNELAPALTFATSTFTFTKGVAIAAITPSNAGGPITGCTASPALPTGLTLAPTTCAVSGTPTATQASTSVAITATNAGGSSTKSISIAVTFVAPSISYSPTTFTFTRTVSVGTIAPTSSGGAIASCTATPALPAGLALSSACVLTGTPSAVTAQTSFTIQATNAAGNSSATLSIRVNDKAPVLGYATTTFTFTKGVAIAAVTPTNTGGAIISCAASPALPAGLSLAATTCALTGTPTATQAAASYSITATNTGGSSSKTLSLAVTLTAPAISFSPSALTFTRGTSIGSIAPVSTGGAIASCTVSPALPAGLALSSACALSGTPTALQSTISYTVSATNSGGTGTAAVSLRVNDVAPSITFATTSFTFTTGVAITAVVPSRSGGAITGCTASPALPAGLTLASTTCTIAGTPTATLAATAISITATNSGGSSSKSLTITVKPPAPALSYSPNSVTFTRGVAVGSVTPSSTGGAIASCAASPALPAGLSLSSACVIGGTPTATQAATLHTVTATNAGGTAQATLTVRVNDAAPALSFATTSFTFTAGTAITAVTPTNGGGAITSCAASPALPAGLSLGATSCSISGTPSAAAASASYAITATNAGGTSTKSITIAVVPSFSIGISPTSFTRTGTGTFTATFTASAVVAGGTAPYVYQWVNSTGGVAAPTQSTTTFTTRVFACDMSAGSLSLTVVDATGRTLSASANIRVTSSGPSAGQMCP